MIGSPRQQRAGGVQRYARDRRAVHAQLGDQTVQPGQHPRPCASAGGSQVHAVVAQVEFERKLEAIL
jgi:hypothetical protein